MPNILPKPTIKMLKPNDLKIEPRAQRRFHQAHADRIAAHFDAHKVGVLEVSQRDNGDLFVFDGQHRKFALIKVGLGDVPVPCNVYQGKTLEQEAEGFISRNKESKKPQAIDIFRVRVTAADPVAVAINDIVEACGLSIQISSQDGGVSAVAALEKVYLGKGGPNAGKPNPDLLIETLGVLQAAWGNQRSAYDAQLILGLGIVLARFGLKIDHASLVKRLAHSGNPATIVGQAKALRDALRSDMANMVGEVIISVYNHGRKQDLLPSIKRRGGAS